MFFGSILTILFFQTGVFGSPQKTLLDNLTRDYGNRSLRPVKNVSDTTIVYFRMLVAQLVEFDERKQQLTINGWLKEKWKDEYLEWNPINHGGIKQLSVSTKDIWIPDITLFDNVDARFENIKDINAHVTYDGLVDWMAPALLKSSCKVKVRYFPFDTQTCILRFASWAYDGGQLDIKFTNDMDAEQDVFLQNGVWELINVDVHRELVKYDCCQNPYTFIHYILTIRRHSTFYYSNIIIPCLLLSILQLLVFWLPPDSGEKISLGMSNLLAVILFQQLIAESTPPLGDETPLIGQYFFAMVVMGCISITSTVCVLHVYHKDNKEVSPILRKLLLRSLSKPPFVRRLLALIKIPGKIIPKEDRENKTVATSLTSLFAGLASRNSQQMPTMMSEAAMPTSEVVPKCNYCGHTSNDTLNKKPESNPNNSVEEKPTWKDIAVFLDRFMFFLLSLCMLVILLYVIVDYVFQKNKHITDS